MVLGYGDDANADGTREGLHVAYDQSGDGRSIRALPLEGRDIVVYVGFQLDGATGGRPRMKVRTVDDFFAHIHTGGGTMNFERGSVCGRSCEYARLNQDGPAKHPVVPRFTYVSPEYKDKP